MTLPVGSLGRFVFRFQPIEKKVKFPVSVLSHDCVLELIKLIAEFILLFLTQLRVRVREQSIVFLFDVSDDGLRVRFSRLSEYMCVEGIYLK